LVGANYTPDCSTTRCKTATQRNTVQRTGNTLQYTATYCNILHYAATQCSTLPNYSPTNVKPTATHCKHTATHCKSLQHITPRTIARQQCNTIVHTATHCNIFQHAATHCNTHHSPTAVQRVQHHQVHAVAPTVPPTTSQRC